ncbi:unnamed protein product [Miscanthus lutarioriparius]|uniref:Transmembrane protein n=1 Tax=Miscanthus lutarioriparius TaxID=422564 RepID=A0A811NHA5_9POAL|nr:unnamed protein product [Miscanthus lutarioriparius]
MDSSSFPAPSPLSSPRNDEATARLLITAILLCVVACVAAALCLRVRQTWHNNKERRRLTKRVAWLRDLLQLLPSLAAAEKEKGGASASTTTATTAQTVRTVLARRLEATVSKVDRLAASASMSMSSCCCLLGFARSYELASRLERANKDVDEVYTHLLPVVTQIDATHRVEQVLVGVMQQQQQQQQEQGGHDGNLAANKDNHSDAQRPARAQDSLPLGFVDSLEIVTVEADGENFADSY